MEGLVTNPRKTEQKLDVHTRVEPRIWEIIDNMATNREITAKTDYVEELILNDLKKRGKL